MGLNFTSGVTHNFLSIRNPHINKPIQSDENKFKFKTIKEIYHFNLASIRKKDVSFS